ncbi:hypothetical protein SLA2020_019360 [Shorea laevis]
MDPYKLIQFRPSGAHNTPFFTMNTEAPVWNNNSSLIVGSQGPILLEDYHLVEKLANFDREQIPKRVVHARGASAKGPLSLLDFPLLFMNVVTLKLRDPQGFSVKFYTREGNFDLVGNNFPVFLYVSHKIIGIWKDLVLIPIINKARKAHYVKFHWKPTCGVKCLVKDEAIRGGGANHSHATEDIYDSIATVSYPEWKLFIQTIDTDHEDKFDFDPLDVTKTWPEDILPLQPVGRLVFNKNIDNFFAENEQLAFGPGIIVLGNYYSDDKLLQTRIFSYSNAQRHPFGPNYLQLPANAPKCSHHNNHLEGFMNFMHRNEDINYFPSRFDPVRHAERFPIPSAICTGNREKRIIERENNFKQPGERYRSFAPDRAFP